MSQILERENETIDPIFAESVVVSAKTTRRFYEAVVLLLALSEAYKDTASKKSNDLPHSTGEDSDEKLFHNFVSRLGQICDSRPGGSTVTAFAVLQQPEHVEYVFSSNRRRTVELETTKAYIRAVLTSLGECSDCEDDDQREEYLSSLLRDVLTFNRERIHRYFNGLTDALEACIAICGTESSSTGGSRQKSFVQMLELVRLANQTDNDDDEFLDHTEKLITALQDLQKPITALFLRKRASNDAAGNTEPWRNLQHHSSRLLAYRRAVEVLWYSGSTWPSLFHSFEVTYISSSTKAPNPLCAGPQTASDFLYRMIPNSVETKGKYLQLAETMQQTFDLDKVIEDQRTKKSFRPIVHAEILVINWLEKTGGTRPERFFHNWQYIGCSKPVCKLCHYYFSSHPSGVQIRGTHGNLYPNWRMPDYADVYGLRTNDEARNKRREILQGIIGHLRQCVLRTLSEKIADSRPCDSNTISSFALNDGHIGISVRDANLFVPRSRLNGLLGPQPQPWEFSEDWETMDGESVIKDEDDRS